ncbi:hypothetical protein N825_25755 [Skermanella stibiiresistens SB22]|uniref:Lipoprotein n=1 Tax=Skermanella stibiiresistens SB22 TaxID=1385369 RepID=W9GS69_9PROT|nr:hypothetical protein [Skermanella stibiiresistens]EWY36730.1 hypothetical protein N825_25755 [Skermanella stibiiresistens SB22]
MRSFRTLLLMVAVSALLTACATQPMDASLHDAPGFFSGIWHGFILPLSLVAGLVNDSRIYAYPNTGWVYDLGFFLGVGGLAGVGFMRK